jgi:hypothetical protein
MIRKVDQINPDAAGVRAYERLYPTFQGLYPALKQSYTALAQFEL